MKLDKRLKNIIDKMVVTSFDQDGQVQEAVVKGYIKILKSLPRPTAIAALTEYNKRLQVEMQKSTLEIESVTPLTQAQIKQIAGAIKKDYPVNEIVTNINSSLLGGLRIKIGDVVFDDSVKQKMLQLKGAING